MSQGRGFIRAAEHIQTDGLLLRDENDDNDFNDPGEASNVVCRVRVIGGAFHRVASVVYGRITIDMHTLDQEPDPFRHVYCGRFTGDWVIKGVAQTFKLKVIARVDGCTGGDPNAFIHDVGRGAEDDADPHG
jgi:hypothetical protein